jgi:dephospho-CoA kinase
VAVPFVGLTGGLGAGKSTALELLAQLGAATLSTDTVVHELLATDELRDLVIERLGPEVGADGALDRARVAERVFADDEARA